MLVTKRRRCNVTGSRVFALERICDGAMRPAVTLGGRQAGRAGRTGDDGRAVGQGFQRGLTETELELEVGDGCIGGDGGTCQVFGRRVVKMEDGRWRG